MATDPVTLLWMIWHFISTQSDEIRDLRKEVRSLRAVIEENIGCCNCEPLPVSSLPRKSAVTRTEKEIEREMILETLVRARGNRTHAARDLGISLRTMRNKLKAYAAEEQ